MAHHQQNEKVVVGYACEFVDVISKELQTECSICLHVLRDPHMVDCCGYRFCQQCIEKVLSDFKSCPLCNHRLPTAIADKQLSRTLRQKKVRCTHKEEGCKWVGELSALDEHLDVTKRMDGCTFKFIRCSFCSSMLRLDRIGDHEASCPRKPVICEYCNIFQCLRHELPQHWENCGLYPIVCPKGCGAKVTRISLDKHYRNWCPLSIVDCEFAYAGCEIKVRRKCMKTHLDESVKDHLDMMTKKISAMTVAYEKEQDINVRLKGQLEGVKAELEDEKVKQRDTSRDEEKTLLKKLCSLRQEDEFDRASDQVLVHNLPPRTTEQMLKSIFGQHGPVYAVNLYSMPFIAVIEYQNNESIIKLFRKYNSTGINLLGYKLKCLHLEY